MTRASRSPGRTLHITSGSKSLDRHPLTRPRPRPLTTFWRSLPSQASGFAKALETDLARLPDELARAEGVRIGAAAAKDILTRRSHDGSDASSEYPGEEKVGRWRPTPPDAMAAAEPHWAKVRPFAVVDVKHYLPLPPPEITSIEYAIALEEVHAFGSARSTTRSADQTEIARFWAQDTVIAFNTIARDLSRATTSH